jgi:hypothetical protein
MWNLQHDYNRQQVTAVTYSEYTTRDNKQLESFRIPLITCNMHVTQDHVIK